MKSVNTLVWTDRTRQAISGFWDEPHYARSGIDLYLIDIRDQIREELIVEKMKSVNQNIWYHDLYQKVADFVQTKDEEQVGVMWRQVQEIVCTNAKGHIINEMHEKSYLDL